MSAQSRSLGVIALVVQQAPVIGSWKSSASRFGMRKSLDTVMNNDGSRAASASSRRGFQCEIFTVTRMNQSSCSCEERTRKKNEPTKGLPTRFLWFV